MQQRFIWSFTAFETKTEGKPYLSAKAAGAKGKDACVSATASRWLKMVKIKQAIDGIVAHRQAVLAEKTGFTIEQAQTEYEEARTLGKACNQPAAMVSATTGKARLYGMDKDAGVREQVVIVIGPKPLVVDSREVVQDSPERLISEDEG